MIGLIGYGSWATALIKMFQETGTTLNWWVRTKENEDFILKKYHNKKYLPSQIIDTSVITPQSNIETVIANSQILILAIPGFFFETIVQEKNLSAHLFKQKEIIISLKGILPDSGMFCSSFLKEKFKINSENISILSGPCHAEEVIQNKRAYLTFGSTSESLSKIISQSLSSPNIRINICPEVRILEETSVLKNIYAITCGILNSQGYGDNFKSVFVTNAAKEIELYARSIAPNYDVINSAILGDLLVTVYSEHSRNNRFGKLIGSGKSADKAIQEMKMIPEGFYALMADKKHRIFDHKILRIIELTSHIVFEPQTRSKSLKEMENILK